MNGRRPERRVGVLLVVKTKRREMMKEEKDPVTALETVVHKGVFNKLLQLGWITVNFVC